MHEMVLEVEVVMISSIKGRGELYISIQSDKQHCQKSVLFRGLLRKDFARLTRVFA